ncbi:MAG: FAD-dependent oxidoreductase [Prevotella sp.]|nr:FAD-dependent oxidoreductase [Prevotella sp.]
MKTDLIIIGSGPGGYRAAEYAAGHGLGVVIIDEREAGGTCLNRGCIPTKALCRHAEIIDTLREASALGLSDLSYTIDFPRIRERQQQIVSQLRGGVEQILAKPGITLKRGHATFRGPRTVAVGDEEYEADNIIIATGARPKMIPACAGLSRSEECGVRSENSPVDKSNLTPPSTLLPPQRKSNLTPLSTLLPPQRKSNLTPPSTLLPPQNILTSDELLAIDRVPARLCIVGAGVIGMEFASIFNSLGSEVTVVEYMKECLPAIDSDIAGRLRKSLARRGITFFMQSAVTEITEGRVTFERKGKAQTVEADTILIATGRRPNVEGLGLEAAGVEYDAKGIKTDDHMQTNVAGIYAIGDVNGRCMLAHAATMQGIHAVNTILGRHDDIRLDIMPSAIFTHPEAAGVGMSEDQCKAQGVDYTCRKAYHRANGKSLTMGEADGMVKLIADTSDGCIIGCHAYGPHSADMVQEISALMCRETTVAQLRDMVHIHPTVGEMLQEAALM